MGLHTHTLDRQVTQPSREAGVDALVAEREAADGYAAPYWTLVKLAERAAAETAG